MDIKESIQIIRQASLDNKLVVFVGAGVSANSGIPTWGSLVTKFAEALDYDKCSSCEDYEGCKDKDVCKRRYQFSSDEYLKIPQYFYDSDVSDNHQDYYDLIKETLVCDATPNAIDDIIFRLLPHHIITTNYDKLLETSEEPNAKLYTVINADSDLLRQSNNRYIIKMHGDIDDIERVVLKESDYIEYEQTHLLTTTFIKALLIDHTFLFVGYSLNDYNLKLIMGWINHLAKVHGVTERLPNFIIHTSDHTKRHIDRYFAANNIITMDTRDLPPLIIDMNSDLNLGETGRLVYSYLDYICNEKYDYQIQPIEDYLFERFEVFENINRIAYADIKKMLHFKSFIKEGVRLLFTEKQEYDTIKNALIIPSKQSERIHRTLSKSGIRYIRCEQDYIEINQSPLEKEQEDLFNTYLANDYINLSERIQSMSDSLAKAFYLNICSPNTNDSMQILDNIKSQIANNEAYHFFNFLVYKFNVICFNQMHFIQPTELHNELESIISLLPNHQKIACTYLQKMHHGTIDNLKMHQWLEKHEAAYYENKNKVILGGSGYGRLADLQASAYEYYFYFKMNYLMMDYFTNPKHYFAPYLKAILCTYIPDKSIKNNGLSLQMPFKNDLLEYSINEIDLDMFVKYTDSKDLKAWIKNYKIKTIRFDNDISIPLKFVNLCKAYAENPNGYLTEKVNNFTIMLTLFDLSQSDVVLIINGFVEMIKKLADSGQLHLWMNIDILKQFVTHYSSFENVPLRELLITLLQDNALKLIVESRGVGSYKNIMDYLSAYATEADINSINKIIESRNSDKEQCNFIWVFSKFLKKAPDKWTKYILGRQSLLNIDQIFSLLTDGIIPYEDSLLSKYIKQIEICIGQKQPAGIVTFKPSVDMVIDQCIILHLLGFPIDLYGLSQYKDHSSRLAFVLDPDSFDYTMVDTAHYMWINIFRNNKYADILKEHKTSILTPELQVIYNNGLLDDDQQKIVYGILLDYDELWSYGRT